MKLAQLILPKFDNAGKSLTWEHAQLQNDLRDQFGGFTWWEGQGSWRDGQRIVNDEVIVYSIAMELGAVLLLKTLARAVCVAARQECVMIVTPNGDVDFVRPKQPEERENISSSTA